MPIDQGLRSLSSGEFVELPRAAANQRHFFVRKPEALRSLLSWANDQGYYLCDLFATDDRLLVERTFKLYYILSSGVEGEDELVVLEHPLEDPYRGLFASVADLFPNATPLEREVTDMFGLRVQDHNGEASPRTAFLLHEGVYPTEFYPLRRRRTLAALQERLKECSPERRPWHFSLPEGMLIVPVGPIHAGIIEAGHFPFHVAGEVVEKLPIRLGYKHRGVEKLFETHYTLTNGWELAEKVSGDTAVAHAIAYCQAVEDLAQITLPPVVHQWRALFLELERIYNHISDMGLLATGLAYERAAAPLATLRELFVHFVNREVSGHRFLRGLNYPGGVRPPQAEVLNNLPQRLEAIVEEALDWGKVLLETSACRARMLDTGILTQAEARYATGFPARASGWIKHDFRRRHPTPAYQASSIQECLEETITPEDKPSDRLVPIYPHALKGDVFARLAIRVAETETSLNIVRQLIEELKAVSSASVKGNLAKRLARIPEMAMGIGYAEGWRGDVMYVIFKGPGNSIARCQLRDPSTFNWHVFAKAVIRKPSTQNDEYLENILADFPLINKSFNLSYAGHDK